MSLLKIIALMGSVHNVQLNIQKIIAIKKRHETISHRFYTANIYFWHQEHDLP